MKHSLDFSNGQREILGTRDLETRAPVGLSIEGKRFVTTPINFHLPGGNQGSEGNTFPSGQRRGVRRRLADALNAGV